VRSEGKVGWSRRLAKNPESKRKSEGRGGEVERHSTNDSRIETKARLSDLSMVSNACIRKS